MASPRPPIAAIFRLVVEAPVYCDQAVRSSWETGERAYETDRIACTFGAARDEHAILAKQGQKISRSRNPDPNGARLESGGRQERRRGAQPDPRRRLDRDRLSGDRPNQGRGPETGRPSLRRHRNG